MGWRSSWILFGWWIDNCKPGYRCATYFEDIHEDSQQKQAYYMCPYTQNDKKGFFAFFTRSQPNPECQCKPKGQFYNTHEFEFAMGVITSEERQPTPCDGLRLYPCRIGEECVAKARGTEREKCTTTDNCYCVVTEA